MTAAMRAREAGHELVRMLLPLAWVATTAAILLAALGAAPTWITGERRDVRRVASIEEAERSLGARLALPAYFPDRLAWPPAVVRIAGGKGGGAALVLHAAADDRPAMELIQSVTPGAVLPAVLLRDRTVLHTSRTTIGPKPATLSRIALDGDTWQELAWVEQGRAMVLRSRGPMEELFRMAHSSHREGRP